LGALAPVVLALVLLSGVLGLRATPRAAGQPPAGKESPYTDASVPATRVTMFGASPAEAPNETWGLGIENGASVLGRYTTETGWSLAPALLSAGGQQLTDFKLDHPEAARYNSPSPLAGQMTAAGSGVLAGATGSGSNEQQVLLVRNPGGSFQETAPLPTEGEAALQKGEVLLGVNHAPMVAALDESGGHAGALVVPVDEESSDEDRVLHWDGTSWTSESIEIPAGGKEGFQVLAMAASSPANAWLLARLSGGSVILLRRHLGTEGAVTTWQPVALKEGGEAGEALQVPVVNGNNESVEPVPFGVPSQDQSQLLTVTSEGVWIEGQRSDLQVSTTMFFKPQGEGAGLTSWCRMPEGTPSTTANCEHALPEVLPTARRRSFAWANASANAHLGERVVTGFGDGVSLRLEGTEFKRVLALGGSSRAGADVGGSYGSAFSNPMEGWLGQELLPVHLTLEEVPSRLTPWPVSFRDALLALAPAPGQAVGALSSEALAVGDEGEVARFKPEDGWMPETLFGPGGRHEAPLLRAVAWPTPTRAYAVGSSIKNYVPQYPMWIWRGETGLWEPDPATPLNFRGNLLGIAFDPNESARGYAVGQSGVLLSYGKTWTQEATCAEGVPEPCLPPQVAQANFTSIAFAGSEAIVAYRKLLPSTDRYEGGLLVNNGSGWQIDEGAAKAMGANVPWAVAGLADGGAAFTASGASEGGRVYERESAGAPWQETATPYPGNGAPGTIAAFRENGALRVVAASSVPDTVSVEDEASAPPGFPPTLVGEYPLASSQEKGVLRQTATGWRDEEHELNNSEEPPGEYEFFDTVYQPDPVDAVLVNSSGALGWAVGGIVSENKRLADTADIWRYPADGVTPIGVKSAEVPTTSKDAIFAIGGGAQCAAPCSDRAEAKVGPDVWLSHALELTREHGAISGVRAFLYTGPRVTTGKTAGPASLAVPYKLELERYAEILRSSPVPAFAAPSSTDLNVERNETTFKEVFSELDAPLGNAKATDIAPVSACAASGEGKCYYSLSSQGAAGAARVIVLDDSLTVGPEQLQWLRSELAGAAAAAEPAIVIGDADLPAEVQAGSANAVEVAEALMNREGHWASAYFYDAPEQNVKRPLQVGASHIETFGSGTLGYVNSNAEGITQAKSEFIGASGFLLAQVEFANRGPDNVAPVGVELVPNIGELALEAKEGTLLRRSQAALFEGLARRPRAGNIAHNRSTTTETDPYIPLERCFGGAACGDGIFPQFTFSSSNPEKGQFVEQNLALGASSVLLGANGKPIPDAESPLFCAYAPGETIVTITAGGLSASLPVHIEAGSVRQPCGTVPQAKLTTKEQAVAAPAPAPSPTPASAAPVSSSPPLPVPPLPAAPAPTPTVHHSVAVPPPFLGAQPLAAFVPAFVPPPLPTPARPTPPSGTSAVTSPVEAPEREEEQEAAPESVSNEAVAYRQPEHEPASAYILGVIVLAAFAGASARRRPGRRRREIRIAPATISSMRSQRQVARRHGRSR
jgi:hypothetical protein